MTTSSPWGADRPLTPAVAASVIGRSFPDIDARGLTFLGSGWDFDAYRTRDDWVFRFPRRADCQRLLDSEARVLRLVSAALSDVARVPVVELRGKPTPEFPYAFAGHRFIPGVGADTLDEALLPALAKTTARALTRLHGVPESEARVAGVGQLDRDPDQVHAWIEHRLSVLQRVDLEPPLRRAVHWVRERTFPAEPYRGPFRLIHHDLSPEHLIVDPGTGVLVGIIDWTDAILGDPARDFVTLVACWGWDFTREALRWYSVSLDDDFIERLRVMARLLSVMWFADAHEMGSNCVKHANWVRNAFAGP